MNDPQTFEIEVAETPDGRKVYLYTFPEPEQGP
jgi:hypothetical protein